MPLLEAPPAHLNLAPISKDKWLSAAVCFQVVDAELLMETMWLMNVPHVCCPRVRGRKFKASHKTQWWEVRRHLSQLATFLRLFLKHFHICSHTSSKPRNLSGGCASSKYDFNHPLMKGQAISVDARIRWSYQIIRKEERYIRGDSRFVIRDVQMS